MAAQAFMMFLSGGEPDAVIGLVGRPVTQDKNDLLLHVNSQAAEHGIGARGETGKSFKHELIRNGLARFDAQRVFMSRRLSAAKL